MSDSLISIRVLGRQGLIISALDLGCMGMGGDKSRPTFQLDVSLARIETRIAVLIYGKEFSYGRVSRIVSLIHC